MVGFLHYLLEFSMSIMKWSSVLALQAGINLCINAWKIDYLIFVYYAIIRKLGTLSLYMYGIIHLKNLISERESIS